MEVSRTQPKNPAILTSFFWVLLLTVTASSLYSYLLFHTFAETFSVVVACSIFIITWNTRAQISNNFLLTFGISLPFVSFLDFLHMLSYGDMNIFPGFNANLPTQLWIAARYLQCFSLFLSIYSIKKNISLPTLFSIYISLFILIILSIFIFDIFPACYIEGVGLTPFKIISEYVISAILTGSIYLLYKNKNNFESYIFKFLILSIVSNIIAELAFTLYIDVYGILNLVGHLFKIISYFFIYKGLVEKGLNIPYDFIFRNLKKREEELEKLLSEIKQLKELLPICAKCKKIRDDHGYWHQVEQYIKEKLEVNFTHGLCPDCESELLEEVKIYQKNK